MLINLCAPTLSNESCALGTDGETTEKTKMNLSEIKSKSALKVWTSSKLIPVSKTIFIGN